MLDGKNALITGATSGIGLAILRALASQGCNLIFNGLGKPKTIERICNELSSDFGIGVAHKNVDLLKPDDIPALIKTAEDRFGHLDILVNNAGIQYLSPIETFPAEQWDKIVAINLSASFHTIQAALPGMKKRGWGRIINIASVNGLVASLHRVAYVAAKHGIVGLTKEVSLEIAQFDITCNAICPGKVRTPLMERQIKEKALKENLSFDEAALAHVSEKHPSKKYVDENEIAALTLFLCSQSSRSINGASLPIDGGWIAQ